MKKRYGLIIVLLMSVMLTFGCKSQEETEISGAQNTESETEGQGAETQSRTLFGTFYAQTLDGEDATEEIFAQAELTMVNIWGTFCGPCIEEMPALGELNREYEDKGFQIVGIISDVTEPEDEVALQIVDETKADYVHMVSSLDLQSGILQYITGVPTTIFLDKEGNMVGEICVGAREKEDWAQMIDELLKEVQ